MLLLFPNLLGEEGSTDLVFPPALTDAVKSIQGLITESEKEGRLYLRRFIPHFREIPLKLLNEHIQDYPDLLQPLLQGERWGLISDAGLPCIADPGSQLVLHARRKGIPIETYVGPCSIILALQLSGLSGQSFTFHGYPPREHPALISFLRTLEKEKTHIFIEAPYRNQKLLEICIQTLQDTTLFSTASDLTLLSQEVHTHSISKWKINPHPNLHKRPTIFLIRSVV